jgi:hypothetical protein
MPSDNRERSFDDALAGHLRSGAKGIPQTDCADAETIAAYHEGALAAEQVASLKTHIAACERCQQILTTLEATDEIPAPAANLILQSTTAPKSDVHVLPACNRALWQWIAPAGALAAALLVWVAVHENNSPIIPANAPSPSAKPNAKDDTRQAETVNPSASRTVTPQSGDSTSSNGASSDSLHGLPSAPRSEVAGLARERAQTLSKQKDSSNAAKKSTAPAAVDQFAYNWPTHKDSLNRNELSAPTLDARNELVLTGPETSASATPAPSAPAPSSAHVHVSTESAELSGGVAQQQEMSGMSRFRQNEVRLANSVAESTISAPDGQVSWRVGQAGIIEFSADAGKSWTLQPSGVISDLLAGSAPGDKVCWIVGRGGTLLRTTDGGAHWQKIPPPSQEDLHSVFAVDARQATVSSASAKYQTTDGGLTWKKLPPE